MSEQARRSISSRSVATDTLSHEDSIGGHLAEVVVYHEP
jgi:hypothetical protein